MLLRPRPPFRLDLTVWSLRRQPHNLVDRWDGRTWRRVLAVGEAGVELQVRQHGPAESPQLELRLRGPAARLPAAREAARAAAERLLGLDYDRTAFDRIASADPRLAPLAARYRGVHPQRYLDLFETLANAVACQQVSLNVGIALLGRLCRRYGRRLDGEPGCHAFARAQDLLHADPQDLRRDGWSLSKARYLLDIAAALSDGSWERRLQQADDAQALQALLSLRGVGRWSAQYALLRGLGRHRCFPVDDAGARKYLALWLGLPAAPDPQMTEALIERWQPCAGLVYFHLLLWRLERSAAMTAGLTSPTA